MRVAISGTSGIGKTTLARHLATQMALPLLPEQLAPLLRITTALASTTRESPRRPELQQAWRRQALLWLQRRDQAAKIHPAFVADRCGFDILSRWLLLDLAYQQPQQLQRLIQTCQQQSADLDLIVVPPISSWSLQPSRNEEGLERDPDLGRKLHTHALLIGLLQQYSRCPVRLLPSSCPSTEARAEMVLRWLRDRPVPPAPLEPTSP